LHVCVSDAASSAGAPAVVGCLTALEDDLFHRELKLRHIGSRRHGDEQVEEGELVDAAVTDGNRANGVKRSSETGLAPLWLSHVVEEESDVIRQSSSAATHGILPA